MELREGSGLSIGELSGLWCVLTGLLLWMASAGFPFKPSTTHAAPSLPLNERVLVVYNQNAPESLQVADYYMGKRGIPASHKCAVNSIQTTHIVDWETYESTIRTPIRNCLNAVGRDQILYIVLAYLTPYKVGSSVKSIDQQLADIWDEYSPGTYRVGRHAYFADAQSQGNAYQPFISLADYRQQPAAQRLYSVWRLDAANAGLAKGLVDKALQAETSGLMGRGCFDIRGAADEFTDYSYGSGEWDIHRSAEHARAAGFAVTEDFHNEEFGTAPATLRCDEAALYAGWYSLNNYNDAFTWKPGAIGLHTDSLSAANVRGGTNWSANALLKGITITSGAVEEPFLDGVAHPDGVFRNLFEGANVGDALLRNTKHLKWMVVNIGDPLYRPFAGGLAPFNSPGSTQLALALNPLNVGGGGSSVATLTLAAPAPAGGAVVNLTSSNTVAATVPSSITIPAGATTASFNIKTNPVTSELIAKITASASGGVISNTLIVNRNDAPSVMLTSPLAGQTFTAPANITLSANASDSDGQVTRVDFYAGATLIGTASTKPFSVTWSNVAAGDYTLTAIATDNAGATESSDAVNVRVNPEAAPTPTPTPVPLPLLLTTESSVRAAALDSVTWVSDPFSVLTSQNFSSDKQTRITLFALNLELRPGENYSVVTAQAEDSTQKVYQLPVEAVGKVPPLDWLSQITVKLPPEIADAGDVWVSINLRSTRSNRVLVRIKP
jgi:uncharacterized protein (TIGR03790 family)